MSATYQIKWVNRTTEARGEGQPCMTKELAQLQADLMNLEYPNIIHYIFDPQAEFRFMLDKLGLDENLNAI